VCVSLPSMRDIIGYEEKDPSVLERLETGYPRFVRHRSVAELTRVLEEEYELAGRKLFLVASERRARELIAFAGAGRMLRHSDFAGVHLAIEETEALNQARLFVQHSGCGLSSREAALALGLPPHAEELVSEEPALKVKRQLKELYGADSERDIYLCRGGMNAFYTAFRHLRDEQAAMGRVHWIQLGWLYLDTARILEKMLPVGGRLFHHYDVSNLDELTDLLRFYSTSVAGIVTEVPTNPLVQTCPLKDLHLLARRHGVALILDPTIASPHNVNILSYSDAHINSLTKYAGNQGDVLAGALALNRESPFFDTLRRRIEADHDPLPTPDVERLAAEMPAYGPTVERINLNARRVATFLEQHPRVSRVWWAFQEGTRTNYEAICRPGGGSGSILTFTVRGVMQRFYDAVPLPKSPSFGATFTMLCPFMYLAHYDLVRDEAGRRLLTRLGLPPDLIRLSVGTEKAEDIIAALEKGLKAL